MENRKREMTRRERNRTRLNYDDDLDVVMRFNESGEAIYTMIRVAESEESEEETMFELTTSSRFFQALARREAQKEQRVRKMLKQQRLKEERAAQLAMQRVTGGDGGRQVSQAAPVQESLVAQHSPKSTLGETDMCSNTDTSIDTSECDSQGLPRYWYLMVDRYPCSSDSDSVAEAPEDGAVVDVNAILDPYLDMELPRDIVPCFGTEAWDVLLNAPDQPRTVADAIEEIFDAIAKPEDPVPSVIAEDD